MKHTRFLPNLLPAVLLGTAIGAKGNPRDTHEFSCPADMVSIVGDALNSSNDTGEALQDVSCVDWINQEFPARCREFDPDAWKKRRESVGRHRMEFCIDRYEWPNVANEKPQVFVTWVDAKKSCEGVGKRLCTEEEWTFACEGEEGLPYPYGYSRNAEECQVDRPWIQPDHDKLFRGSSEESNQELAKLWQGSVSGSRTKCSSPFGVEDMTGNVDEWTTSTRGRGNVSIMKGGYWGPVRARCRPSTRVHNEWHKYYQQGFRCCKSL